MMKITGLSHLLSGRTLTTGGWLNTFLPHCMSCNKMQINYLKIIQCDFLDFCFRFRLSQLRCTYDVKLQTSTCFVSRNTADFAGYQIFVFPTVYLKKCGSSLFGPYRLISQIGFWSNSIFSDFIQCSAVATMSLD